MHRKTIEQLNEDLKAKKITPQELYESSLAHLQTLNPILNAANLLVKDLQITLTDFDNPLAGIPTALKDNIITEGTLSTSSSYFLQNFKPPYDATINKRLHQAGISMIAKTNMDEFGIGDDNCNSIFGRAKNPYDPKRITGGSSGGSAALVSAGIVPYAIGSDTGDSVRQPALYCGVYGYKPTYTTISRYGLMPYGSSLDQAGVLSRSVADIAIVLQNIAGADDKDPTTLLNANDHAYYQNLTTNVKPLKIAYIKEIVAAFDNQTVLDHFAATKDYLQSLKHEITEVSVDKDLLRTIKGVYQIIVNSEMTSNSAAFTGIPYGERISINNDFHESIMETRRLAFQTPSKARLAIGAMSLHHEKKAEYYLKAKKVRAVLIKTFEEIFAQYDVIISPGLNQQAPEAKSYDTDAFSDPNLIANTYLTIANLIGAPSIAIPTHLNNNLPLGISFMSKPFSDQLLLNLAYQFEQNIEGNQYGLISFYNRYVEEVK